MKLKWSDLLLVMILLALIWSCLLLYLQITNYWFIMIAFVLGNVIIGQVYWIFWRNR